MKGSITDIMPDCLSHCCDIPPTIAFNSYLPHIIIIIITHMHTHNHMHTHIPLYCSVCHQCEGLDNRVECDHITMVTEVS